MFNPADDLNPILKAMCKEKLKTRDMDEATLRERAEHNSQQHAVIIFISAIS
jgi:hypothetical protein